MPTQSRLQKLLTQLSRPASTTAMSSHLIFITGSTGFIGSQVVSAALKAGHRVRLSVRKQEQIQKLKSLFAAHADKLDFVVIPDITKPDAFDGSLAGVDYIFHLASPMPGKGSDFKADYVAPAVQGTESMLNAAKAEKSVKRVIIVSSFLAVVPLGKMNDSSLHVTDGSGDDLSVDINMSFPDGLAGHGLKYQASKILAHQASKNWVKEHQPHFSLITLHPTFVVGPSLIQTSAEDADAINSWLWASLHSEKPLLSTLWVDVRDVADAHIKALDAPIGGAVSEFLLNGPKFTWDDVIEYVKTKYPQLDVKLQPPFDKNPSVETPGAENVLGIKWRGFEEMAGSVLDQQLSFRS